MSCFCFAWGSTLSLHVLLLRLFGSLGGSLGVPWRLFGLSSWVWGSHLASLLTSLGSFFLSFCFFFIHLGRLEDLYMESKKHTRLKRHTLEQMQQMRFLQRRMHVVCVYVWLSLCSTSLEYKKVLLLCDMAKNKLNSNLPLKTLIINIRSQNAQQRQENGCHHKCVHESNMPHGSNSWINYQLKK